MISFNDAIKSRIDNSDAKVSEAANVVKAWIVDELDILAKKRLSVFENFLNSVPELLEKKDDQKDFDDYFYLIVDDEYLVHYSKDYIFLTVDIRRPVPDDVLAALKIGKLVDTPQFDFLLSAIPFTVTNDKGEELIKTLLDLSQVGFTDRVHVSLTEFTYQG